MTSIKEDVEFALISAYQKFIKCEGVSFIPNVETRRTIVFNSMLDDILLKESKENQRHFGKIRKDEPRLFHQILGLYYCDFMLKDRIYSLDNDENAYYLEAVVLTPEISIKKFYNNRKALCSMLSRLGTSEFYKTSSMDHVEVVLNKFHDNWPLAFKKTKFSYVTHTKDGNIITYPLKDYILFGNGYAVKKETLTYTIPNEKKDYQGPFIHLVSRGEKKHFEKHLDIIDKLIETLE